MHSITCYAIYKLALIAVTCHILACMLTHYLLYFNMQVNNLREASNETGTDNPGKSKKCFPVYSTSGQTARWQKVKGYAVA